MLFHWVWRPFGYPHNPHILAYDFRLVAVLLVACFTGIIQVAEIVFLKYNIHAVCKFRCKSTAFF